VKHTDLDRGDPVEVEINGAWVRAVVVRVIADKWITLQLQDGTTINIFTDAQVRSGLNENHPPLAKRFEPVLRLALHVRA
jgi:hypothetical protein